MVLQASRIVLDLEGAIEAEYHRHLNPHGQPGVGDRFYLEVLNSAPQRVERVHIPRTATGDYSDFPTVVELAAFDQSDRKFAALARREGIPVANATDSDWLTHADALAANGIRIRFVCGCEPRYWFTAEPGGARRR